MKYASEDLINEHEGVRFVLANAITKNYMEFFINLKPNISNEKIISLAEAISI